MGWNILEMERIFQMTSLFASKLEYPFWSAVCFIQSKSTPAVHEAKTLSSSRLNYVPNNTDKFIFNIDGFNFSTLICNEFLNISNRSNLRGKIDCLIVIAWNKDTSVYSSITESGALDLHAFIMVVNNRIYGDTRLYGPYKKNYLRDLIRITGGNADIILEGSLNHKLLQDFQTEKRK